LPQDIEIERRLAAVLAADVAGFSRLTDQDEVGTMRMLAAQRSILDAAITRHKGRIANTAGDSVLAEFPSAVNAVQCAVEAQQALRDAAEGTAEDRRVLFRIGIHVGDVMVRGSDLLGSGVNVAARLEALADPGGIIISSAAHEQVKKILPLAYADLGAQQVKNIEEPVRAFAIGSAPAAVTASMLNDGKPLPLPDKPSIAVLPFQNMSGDAEQEYFADGMVEDIITALSRFKSLFVIARNSSFTYKGKAVDIKQVGRDLGVRYVLEGSVRKASNRLRITGQLIETTTNNHLWADRFDGALIDVFELQDQITAKVVGIIAPRIHQSELERTRSKPTNRLDSYDFCLRGNAATADRTKWAEPEMRNWFKQACELDPNYAAAYAGVAQSLVLKQTAIGKPLASDERAEAIEYAENAYRLGSDDATVVAKVAHALAYIGQSYDRATALIDEAVALNENDATTWILRGWISVICAQPDRALESFERLLQLSPLDTRRHSVWNGMGFAYFLLRRFEDGCLVAARAADVNLDFHTLSALIVNEVGAGRVEEARRHATQLSQLRSDLRASHARELLPVRSLEMKDRLLAALREAGLPE
jgi:TolB-like protein/class 3 adenylate cyclase